jgi:hypothetical protein
MRSAKFRNKAEILQNSIDHWKPSQKYILGFPCPKEPLPHSPYLDFEYHLDIFGSLDEFSGLKEWCSENLTGKYDVQGPYWKILHLGAHFHIRMMDPNDAILAKLRWM